MNDRTTSVNQTKTRSLVEATTNTGAGLVISWLVTWLLLPPLFGIDVGPVGAAEITALYTVVSIARNYIVRRVFTKFGKGS